MSKNLLVESRLIYFYEAVSLGSMRRAADKMKIAASAVSRQIKLLEQELGVILVERHRKGVVPTQAGLLLINFYRQQRSHKEDMMAELQLFKGLHKGSVSLVMGEGFTQVIVERLLPIFRQQYPNIAISIDIAGTTAIMRRLAEDVDEIGLVYYPPDDPKITAHWIGTQPMHAIVLPNHPIADRKSIALAELEEWPLALLHGRYGIRQLLEHAQQFEKFTLRSSLSTNLISVLMSFVQSGQGLTLLPKFSVATEVTTGRLSAVLLESAVLSQAEVQVVTRAGRYLSPAARCFLRYCIQSMNALESGVLYGYGNEL